MSDTADRQKHAALNEGENEEHVPPPGRAEEDEAEGVSIRSRPPIFYFWPTLVASLWFMAFLGLRDQPVAAPQPAAAGAEVDAQPAQDARSPEAEADLPQVSVQGPLAWLPVLPRGVALVVVAVVVLLIVVYLLLHLIFNYSNSRLVESMDAMATRDLFLNQNIMDVFFWLLVLFVVFSPGYGLLTFLAFHAFGLMTDHATFTHAPLLRKRLFWIVGAIVAAVVLSILRFDSEATVAYQYDLNPTVSAVFFVLLTFNLFVLAFDFNGASLVALVAVVIGLVAVVVMFNIFYPAVGAYFVYLGQSTYGLQLNSNFYQFYAYVMSLLMVFSGLIAKADFWRITPLSIVHYQGLLVQRSRHYGALVNFHYHVEFPDFFESMLGGWAGDFILSLPREDRPEVVSHVWYARYYNQKIRQLLDRADVPAR